MNKTPKTPKPKKPTQAEIAAALGISPRHCATLCAAGMPTESIAAALAWRGSSKAAVDELRQARIELVRQQIEAAEIANAERRGELVSAAAIHSQGVAAGAAVRAALFTFVNNAPGLLAGLDEAAIFAVLRRELIEMLTNLSSLAPAVWFRGSPEILRHAWAFSTDEDRAAFKAEITRP